MQNVTPQKPLTASEVRINTQALAAVVNLRCEGIFGLLGKTVKFENVDAPLTNQTWKLELPAEFAGFVQPGEMCIVSITLLKNILEPIPTDEGTMNSKGIILPKGGH